MTSEQAESRVGRQRPIVTIRLGGGLGNQLFQYALGRRMSLANGADLMLDASGYKNVLEPDPRKGIRALGLEHFHIKGALIWTRGSDLPERPWFLRKYVKWTCKLRLLLESWRPYYLRREVVEPESRHFWYDERIIKRIVKGQAIYNGYWQSEKYFLQIETFLRKELTVVDPMDAWNAELAKQIRFGESVSVHVRHGDNANGVETALGVLPREYYERAMDDLRQRIPRLRAFVFSDDIGWARSMIPPAEETVFVDHNEDLRNYEDLRLMTLCNHHIIANSTFSWWGAWLGKKDGQIVYAPRRYWQNIDRTNPDLYPASWRLI